MIETDRTTDRTTNLLISSNVHFVHLGGDNKRETKHHELQTVVCLSVCLQRVD